MACRNSCGFLEPISISTYTSKHSYSKTCYRCRRNNGTLHAHLTKTPTSYTYIANDLWAEIICFGLAIGFALGINRK